MPEVPRFKFIYSGVRVFATEKSHRREIYVAAEGMGTRQKLLLCDFRRISVSQDGSDFSPRLTFLSLLFPDSEKETPHPQSGSWPCECSRLAKGRRRSRASLSRPKLRVAGTSSPFLSSPAQMPAGAQVVVEMPRDPRLGWRGPGPQREVRRPGWTPRPEAIKKSPWGSASFLSLALSSLSWMIRLMLKIRVFVTNLRRIAWEVQGRQGNSLVFLQAISIDMNDVAQEKPRPVTW